MSLLLDLTNTARLLVNSSTSSLNTNSTQNLSPSSNSLILQAPQPKDILFFNENGFNNNNFLNDSTNNEKLINQNITNKKSNLKLNTSNNINTVNSNYVKKKVKFPDDDKIIRDYSEAPKRGWIPGKYSTNDLLDAYIRSCDRHKTKILTKLMPHLKALQDIDCANGEKVNVLNLKSEKLDSKQMESFEEIFKRLSFKTIDLDMSQFEDDTTGATLFEILDYYDTCERLILSNVKGFGIFGWQELSKYIRKTVSLETIDLRGQLFNELMCFTYLARSFRLTQSLRVIHLENSNVNGRLLIMLSAALKDNEQIKEIYLCDNKIQPTDGNSIAQIIKENKCLELIDLKNNNLQDSGLAHICSGLSEKTNSNEGLKSLHIANNSITTNGINYLSKALIHNRSITSLNISNNSLTNEAIYELKEALIVNKNICCLILCKVKLGDEGVIALAEYLAETQSLRRLDLRENDVRLGGLMALASSLKFNKTLDRLDLDRETKKEYSIKDSVETSKRLLQDINEFCLRNKREREKHENILKELERQREEEEYVKLLECSTTTTKEDNNLNETNENDLTDKTPSSTDSTISTATNEEDIDIINQDDELLKKILNHSFNNLHSPIEPTDDIIYYFNKQNDNSDKNQNETRTEDEEFQFIEKDLNLTPAEFDKIILNSTPIPTSNHINNCVINNKNKLDFELDHNDELIDLLNYLTKKVESDLEQEKTDNIEIINLESKQITYDLDDELSFEVHKCLNDSLNLITPESTTSFEDIQNESNILISSSPFYVVNKDDETFFNDNNNENNSINSNTEVIINNYNINIINNNNINNNKPFFASKLTNSQLSEEISNEIGL